MKTIKFKDYLKEKREEKGESITGLSKLSGISRPYLSQLESGNRKPSPELINKLAEPLGVDLSTLLHIAGNEDLAQGEKLREAVADFADENYIHDLLEQADALKHTLDIKDFMEKDFEGVRLDKVSPLYNGHELTETDRRRILDMLKTLFPEYEKE